MYTSSEVASNQATCSKDSRKKHITKALILVGGLGSRLYPLTLTVPKPLVPFCNKPILKYQIEKLVNANVTEIILAVNYFSELIIEQCREYEREYNIRIIYSKEDQPLGTGGPLALAREYLKDTSFFVLNSDICCNADLSKMKERFMKSEGLGTIMTYMVDDPTKYGLIKVNEGKIESFEEKPKVKAGSGPWIINAGMYIFTSEILNYIELKEVSIERDIFPKLALAGLLNEYSLEGYWIDIGQSKDYIEGQQMELSYMSYSTEKHHKTVHSSNEKLGECLKKNSFMLPSNRIRPLDFEQFDCPGFYVNENVVLGKNITLGKNVFLRNCTIFDNCIIEDNCRIENSIIGWDCVIGKNSILKNDCVLGRGVIIKRDSYVESKKISAMIH
jgi:mannose-1-phosphate guanylyltransferase